ncbi:replication-relaxation family protein [Acidobacteria bacterium AH-259-D05]|nr:replication-relaxation family protein [Acidobacteria bacterium AH-259-D05]
MQQRLPKFSRAPEAVEHRQITQRSLEVLAAISRYRFIPTSILVRLIDGNQLVTSKHLQQLYHKGLVNRFSVRHRGRPGEFFYYLDNPAGLQLLVDYLEVPSGSLPWREIRNNREKGYARIMRTDEAPGQLLFLKHELMISRFHAMVELGCRHSQGQVELVDWRQGPELWDRIEVPTLRYDSKQQVLFEHEETKKLPHRPDAFFSLHFPNAPEGGRYSHFFYEADRKTSDTDRFVKKLRVHFHFVVRQKRHRLKYNTQRIRAVLTETLDTSWAENLREAARHPAVSGEKPSPLFWFTASQIFEQEREVPEGKRLRKVSRFLAQPNLIFEKVWASPVNDKLISLLD